MRSSLPVLAESTAHMKIHLYHTRLVPRVEGWDGAYKLANFLTPLLFARSTKPSQINARTQVTVSVSSTGCNSCQEMRKSDFYTKADSWDTWQQNGWGVFLIKVCARQNRQFEHRESIILTATHSPCTEQNGYEAQISWAPPTLI